MTTETPKVFDLSILETQADPFAPPSEPVIRYSDFPHVIDNTAREQFFTCPTKFFRSSVQKLAPKRKSEHLTFGAAFAYGLETLRKAFYDDHLTQDEAFQLAVIEATRHFADYEPPEGSIKTYSRLIEGLYAYVERYPLATDHIQPHRFATGKAGIEFTFAVPIPDCFHPVSGEPLLYGGRFDMIGTFNGSLLGLDDKTTSRLGASWNRQWRLNSQITGYCWAAREYGIPLAGMVMRGQSILTAGSEFAEVIEYRPDWKIERWLEQLKRDIRRMLAAYKSGVYDQALGAACVAYSGCPFDRLCTVRDPEPWIDTDYRNHIWNPLSKDPEAPTTTKEH